MHLLSISNIDLQEVINPGHHLIELALNRRNVRVEKTDMKRPASKKQDRLPEWNSALRGR
jgi:hypothetical protein